jgi:hypothetical protein
MHKQATNEQLLSDVEWHVLTKWLLGVKVMCV